MVRRPGRRLRVLLRVDRCRGAGDGSGMDGPGSPRLTGCLLCGKWTSSPRPHRPAWVLWPHLVPRARGRGTRALGDGALHHAHLGMPWLPITARRMWRPGAKGAPLVPLFDSVVLSDHGACLNLGGHRQPHPGAAGRRHRPGCGPVRGEPAAQPTGAKLGKPLTAMETWPGWDVVQPDALAQLASMALPPSRLAEIAGGRRPRPAA